MLGLVAFCYAFRRRKRPADSPEPDEPAVPFPLSIQSKIYTKRQGLLRALLKDSEGLLKNRLKVCHLMTHDLITVLPTASAGEVKELMAENGMRHVLVCSDDKRLLGVISNRDLERSGRTATDIMSSDLQTVAPDMPLSPAITVLIEKGISCLPVVEKERLCGVLTVTDLIITLQCTLQVWLQVAQVIDGNAGWTAEMRKVSDAIDRNLAEQEARLTVLREWHDRLESRHQKSDLWDLSQEISKILAANQLLAKQIGDVRRQLESQIERLGSITAIGTDPATRLSTRQGLDQVTEMLLAMKKRYWQPFCLVIISVDQLRDASQSLTGKDRASIRQTVAKLIDANTRESDYPACYSEHAFALALPQAEPQDAKSVCERVCRLVARATRISDQLTISAGIASAIYGEDIASLYKRAEAVLLEAQSAGGNSVLCHPALDPEPAAEDYQRRAQDGEIVGDACGDDP